MTYIILIFISGVVALVAGDGLAQPAAGRPDISIVTGRPPALQQEVDEQFTQSQLSTPSPYQFHGEEAHKLMGIPDLKLVDLVISNAIGRREKDVYFLDIGAGKFQWLNTLSDHLNNAYSEYGMTFHLWGVTERKTGNTKSEEVLNGYTVECVRHEAGCCKFRLYTSFPIENIAGLLTDPQNRFDLIVSNLTFASMRDPANTFIQAYNLLRLNTGLLLMENFDVDFTVDPASISNQFMNFSADCAYSIFDVFFDILGIDYMMRSMKYLSDIYDHTIIKKGADSLQMAIPYVGDSMTKASKKICCFQRTEGQWMKYQYMNVIIPGAVVRYRDRVWPQVMQEHFSIKGKNYKDFLSMLLPIVQEKRNNQAMAMQRESSAVARRMDMMYATAWPAFHNSDVDDFAKFYHTQYEQPVLEAQEVEDVKETLRFLLYIIVSFKQRLILKQPDFR